MSAYTSAMISRACQEFACAWLAAWRNEHLEI